MVKPNKAVVPKLRFPEFREEGEWAEAPLEKLITTITPPAKLPTSNYQQVGKYPIVDQSQQIICGWTDDAAALVDGASPLIVFGDHTCVLKLIRQPFVQGADGIKILKAKSDVSSEYLFHSLTYRPLVMEDYKRHFTILRDRRVYYPDIVTGEQQKIADCLTSLDELIAAQGRKVEALKTYKRGLMQQLFPREGETVPRLRFPEFRDAPGWILREIGDVFKVTRGEVLAMPLVQSYPDNIAQYPVFSSQTKNAGLAGYYTDFLYEDAITWTTDGANAGDVNFRSGKFYCTNVCGVLLNKDGYANPCVAALINGVSKNHVSYVGNPKLMNGVMAKITIPFPSVAEQQKIAICISSIDLNIATVSSGLDALKVHKQALMQQLFPVVEETEA